MWKLIAFKKDKCRNDFFSYMFKDAAQILMFLPVEEDEGQSINSTVINIMILIIIIIHFYSAFHLRVLQ